jgi:hypothetical protein
MHEIFSEFIQSSIQSPLVMVITVLAVIGTVKELHRRRGDFATAYLIYVFFACSFLMFAWARGAENPFSDRFRDAFGAYVLIILPGLMLYVRNAQTLNRGVPWWAYLVVGCINIACAIVPLTTQFYNYTEDDKIANHGVSTGFVCVFISLWVLTQLPFERNRFNRRLCLVYGLIGYIGAIGYLAKYLAWYYVLYPIFFIRVFMLVSASRKWAVWIAVAFCACILVAAVPSLATRAIQNRAAEAYTVTDYIDYKITRSWLGTDFKIFGMSDGGRLSLWRDYLEAYSESPLLGVGFGYRPVHGIMEHSFPLYMTVRAGVVGWVFLLAYLYYNYRIWMFMATYHPRIRWMARTTQFFVNLSMCFTTIYVEIYILTMYYTFFGTMLARERET